MKKNEPDSKRDQVDETGRILEKFGIAPMSGRVLALFTVSDSGEMTFEDIVSFFGSSKSVISNSLASLLNGGLIDYKTHSAGRKRYFYLTDRFLIDFFANSISAMSDLREALYKTLSERTPKTPEVNARITKWIETANVFEKHLQSATRQITKEH